MTPWIAISNEDSMLARAYNSVGGSVAKKESKVTPKFRNMTTKNCQKTVNLFQDLTEPIVRLMDAGQSERWSTYLGYLALRLFRSLLVLGREISNVRYLIGAIYLL